MRTFTHGQIDIPGSPGKIDTKKRQKEFDTRISDYLVDHPELIEAYDAERAHNKKAARRLGLISKPTGKGKTQVAQEPPSTNTSDSESDAGPRKAGPSPKPIMRRARLREPDDASEIESDFENRTKHSKPLEEESRSETAPELHDTDVDDVDDEEEVLAQIASHPLPRSRSSSSSSSSTSSLPTSRPLPPSLRSKSSAEPTTKSQSRTSGKSGVANQTRKTIRARLDDTLNDFDGVREAPDDAPIPKWAGRSGKRPLVG